MQLYLKCSVLQCAWVSACRAKRRREEKRREEKRKEKETETKGTNYGPTSPRQSSITTSNSPSRDFSPRFSSLRTPNTVHASEEGTPWQMVHLDGFEAIHELVVEARPFIMRSYADGRCGAADEFCVVVVVVVVEEVSFDSFRLFGCRLLLFDVGGDSATCERLGDRATVDVGEPIPSLRENTLSARLQSSPESKPESKPETETEAKAEEKQPEQDSEPKSETEPAKET